MVKNEHKTPYFQTARKCQKSDSVISRLKWLKFGVQAHLFKMIGHTKFQLSIFCTFKVMKLLVEVKVEQNFDKN